MKYINTLESLLQMFIKCCINIKQQKKRFAAINLTVCTITVHNVLGPDLIWDSVFTYHLKVAVIMTYDGFSPEAVE